MDITCGYYVKGTVLLGIQGGCSKQEQKRKSYVSGHMRFQVSIYTNLLILRQNATIMILCTPVKAEDCGFSVSLEDRILVLGSCFADNIGARMSAAGFNVCINPFGTLYNPASVWSALSRLDTAEPFAEDECVEMGAGAGLICSFSHHTSFARPTVQEFLDNANKKLADAAAFWRGCNKLIITFGTAMVWRHDGIVVSNCLKLPAKEFTHEMLSVAEIKDYIGCIESLGKDCLFTVSPIRHLSQGAHANTISKAALQIAIADMESAYFPSYEILLDELRDYRFFADDMCHPTSLAVDIIWERFVGAAVPEEQLPILRANEKAARRAAHRNILK